jgi:hypothetical protein
MKPLSITLVYLSAPFIVAHSLPKCSDLSDNEGKFVVDGFEQDKGCDWAARQDTIFRCYDNSEVLENCPITCRVPCNTEIPSASPSTSFPSLAPSTSFPSLAPSSSPTDFILCENKVDSTERFSVPGTQGGETRSCDWASRMDTTFRCSFEPVPRACPLTCDLPCRDAVVEEPEEPPREDGFSSIIETPKVKAESFPYAIVFGSMGAVAGLALIAFVTQKKEGSVLRKIFSKDSDAPLEQHNLTPLEFDEMEDVIDEGYNSALCGWGSTVSDQKTKVIQPVGEV